MFRLGSCLSFVKSPPAPQRSGTVNDALPTSRPSGQGDKWIHLAGLRGFLAAKINETVCSARFVYALK